MLSAEFSKDSEGRDIVPNLIDGKPVILPASATFPVTSAKQEKVLHYGQTASVEVAIKAVDAAAKAFKTYKKTSAHARRGLLNQLVNVLLYNAEVLDKTQAEETSASGNWQGAAHTVVVIQEIAAAIHEATTGQLVPSQHGSTNMVFKEPVGPVLIIPPWNAALVLAARGMASALAAGCTVVIKASELCPQTHKLLVDCFHEAGFPSGAINLVMADRSAGAQVTEALISHPQLRKIEFIGSAPVGRIIGGVAAKYLKPIVLELGDQSPAIVLDDADLPHAARLCVRGAMIHHGQVCFATERIIVQSAVLEDFSRRLVQAMREHPFSDSAVTKAAADKAQAALDAAVRGGAKFLYGSSERTGPASLAPSILTDVPADASLSSAEAFAPTAFIVPVDTEDEAVAEANSRSGGLAAAVFTGSHERGLRLARDLEFGGVQINQMTLVTEPAGPITGHKGSGWGSVCGKYGIEEFVYNKLVSLGVKEP